MAGSRLELSVGDMPFAENGKAGSLLLVCVTDAEGKAVTGLTKGDFKVHWLRDISSQQALKTFSVDEMNGSGNLPNVPGAYAVQMLTKSDHWTPLSDNVVMFVIAVTHGPDRGEIVYKVTDPLVRDRRRSRPVGPSPTS